MTNALENLISAVNFETAVPPYGYRWWYVDAFSNDYQYGLTLIAFIGSVFSPYYAWSRHRGNGNPYNHSAINISLYGKGGKRWSMTERGQDAVKQSSNLFSVGPSSLELQNGQLVINVNEWTAPIPGRLKGQIRVTPLTVVENPITLNQHANHYWHPIAPICEVDVALSHPMRRWTGRGYFDTNWGAEPIEAGFRNWDWSRTNLPDGRSAILYNGIKKNGKPFSLGLCIDHKGNVSPFKAGDSQALKKSLWRINRQTQSDDNFDPVVVATLEDAPFYARSMIRTSILGYPVTAMHESLNLDRFSSTWVKALLPFKMPRRSGRL